MFAQPIAYTFLNQKCMVNNVKYVKTEKSKVNVCACIVRFAAFSCENLSRLTQFSIFQLINLIQTVGKIFPLTETNVSSDSFKYTIKRGKKANTSNYIPRFGDFRASRGS